MDRFILLSVSEKSSCGKLRRILMEIRWTRGLAFKLYKFSMANNREDFSAGRLLVGDGIGLLQNIVAAPNEGFRP